jgi:hypothetical protein
MVNTSTKEALPNVFLEAAVHRCTNLAGLDPDGFSLKFGYFAQDENFADGVKYLLVDNRWKEHGERGYRYVKETFATEKAMRLHLNAYESLLNRSAKG